jgi:RHS repeat-associated protein
VLKTILADGSFSQTGYDGLGRQTSVTDQMDRPTQYQYDTFGRLTAVLLPAVLDPETGKTVNPTTNYTYNIYGNLIQIQDAKGRLTQFTFDQFGHQLTRTLPLGQQESTTYDAFGREGTHTDFKGQQTVFHYDSLGRVDTKTFYPYGSSTPEETVVYHFDNLGRNDTVTDTIGTSPRLTTYGFDLENRVTSITTPEGTVNYVYDPATSYHTETSTANSDTSYAYDQLGRLKAITLKKQNGVILTTPLVGTYYYTPVGNIDHVTYPNGTETDYGYDTLNRVTSVTNKQGTTLLSSYVYTLEADALRTGVTEQQLQTDGTYSTVTKTWTYDALQRLMQEQVVSSIAGKSYTDTYAFDLVGNRLSKTDLQGTTTTVVSSVSKANDEMTSDSATVNGAASYSTLYGYDANGSETSASRTGTGAETDTYGYDLQNRLSTANISRTETGQSVTIAASYTYDESGFRAQSVIITTIGSGSPSTTTTQFLVDRENPTRYSQVLEEHTNGSSTPSISYLLGLALFGQTNGSGASSFLLVDAQGSTRLVTDSSGNVTARLAYDGYGNMLGTAIGILNPPATKILFTGQQFDPTLLQEYLRARFYNSNTGRFLSADSFLGHLAEPETLNRYGYVDGDPVNRTDPTGHDGDLLELLADITARTKAYVTNLGARIAAAFAAGGAAIGRFWNTLGEEVRLFVQEVLDLFPELDVKGEQAITNSSRIVDFGLRSGDKAAQLEVKYSIPRQLGPSMDRLVAQINAMVNSPSQGQAVVFTLKEPTAGQLARVASQLPPGVYDQVIFLDGALELADWIQKYFGL